DAATTEPGPTTDTDASSTTIGAIAPCDGAAALVGELASRQATPAWARTVRARAPMLRLRANNAYIFPPQFPRTSPPGRHYRRDNCGGRIVHRFLAGVSPLWRRLRRRLLSHRRSPDRQSSPSMIRFFRPKNSATF